MIDELIAKITTASRLSEEEIKNLIEEKQIELSGLISEEGAAYLVAKELGLELRRETERLNIENVMPGMQNVNVTGKITRISPVREFKTEKAEGRVANITIGDKTGSVRMSLWNEEIEKLAGLAVGDVVNIRGYVKSDNLMQPEIRLGRKGEIVKLEGEEISQEFVSVAAQNYQRVSERSFIGDLREGLYRSVRAPILQVFEGNVFYEVCPECKKRLKETDQGWNCAEHGSVEAEYNIVISGIIDDGTGNVRAVFFNDVAEKLIGTTKVEAKKLFDRKKKLEAVLSLIPLGKDFVFDGRVRHNDIFDRLEFIVNSVSPVDLKKEIEGMMGK
jgi:ssDNA-binding replication factor A large subunit